jgi:serine/threonine-protein kinase RsbW
MKRTMQQKKKKTIHRKTIFRMVCQSNPKEIVHIENFLQQIRLLTHIDDGMMYRMLVSCTEAVNNAIVHGNKSNPEKKVNIRCIVSERILTICVADEGKGFDPDSLQDPRDEANLLKENGRGVFLMRSLMDKVTFKRLKSGCVVEMKVKLHR